MSNLFLTEIVAATPAAVATTAPTSLLYGADLSCADDCDSLFTELAEDDPRLVAQSVWRTITSPRGSIPGAPDLGWDIRALVRLAATPSDQRKWPGLLKAEIAKDDRVSDVSVKFEQTSSDSWKVTIDGTTETGPFELVGELTPTSTTLTEITV